MSQMPSVKAHIDMDERLFGRKYPEVHAQIDAPTEDLGAFHRLFFHSIWDVLASKPEYRKVVLAHHLEDFFLTPLMPFVEPNRANWEFVHASEPHNVLEGIKKWWGNIGIR